MRAHWLRQILITAAFIGLAATLILVAIARTPDDAGCVDFSEAYPGRKACPGEG